MSDPQNASSPPDLTRNQVLLGDNLEWAARLPDACAQLIYLDPPFNTGKRQRRLQQRAARDDSGAGRPAFACSISCSIPSMMVLCKVSGEIDSFSISSGSA